MYSFFPLEKYEKEFDPLRNAKDGIYSITDRKALYYFVRETQPKTILDLGAREGATTSTILAGLAMNKTPLKDIQYYIFEKDKLWLQNIKEFVEKTYPEVNFYFHENIIGSEVLKKMPPIDLLFIDANHDYILAKWYIDNLFPLAHDNSLIHIHDIYYNRNGNGWKDVSLLKSGCRHPDIVNPSVHKKLYPTIYYKYAQTDIHVPRYEEDEIRDYCLTHAKEIDFFSTTSLPFVKNGWRDIPNCSFYIWKKNANFNIGT